MGKFPLSTFPILSAFHVLLYPKTQLAASKAGLKRVKIGNVYLLEEDY